MPAGAAAVDHPICGEFVQEVSLPDSVRAIHNGVFYNCRGLRRLIAGPGLEVLAAICSPTGRSLRTFALRAAPNQPTG